MKTTFTLVSLLFYLFSFGLDPDHFTITRVTAPYFIVDANAPNTINQAYVGFEVRNNSNSATVYTGIKFNIISVVSSVSGQHYSVIAPSSGQANIGTLAPGESRVCYFYVNYPASVTPQASFNVRLSNNTNGVKDQVFVIANRSCISANAGGTATQTFASQDVVGGIVTDDVTYTVGNVRNGDENDFQVAVSNYFDADKLTLLSTQVIASQVAGIRVGTTDSLYFISGNASTGSTVTIRFTFRISGTNFTTYLLPCAGATSGNSNYKYALNSAMGIGTPITITSPPNSLTISKVSDDESYVPNATAVFTVTIRNNNSSAVTIDRITDQIPAGFSYQALHGTSNITAVNSTSVPSPGSTGTIVFEGGVVSGNNTSYTIPAGGSISLRYIATTAKSPTPPLVTTARHYIASTEIGSANDTVIVTGVLTSPVSPLKATKTNTGQVQLQWSLQNPSGIKYFDIERSSSAGSFRQIGRVEATGNSNSIYTFTDESPLSVFSYYRLRITDMDLKTSYSPVAVIANMASPLTVYDLKFNNQLTQIEFKVAADAEKQMFITLIDPSGKQILYSRRNLTKGENSFLLNTPSLLQKGVYVLRVTTAGDKWQGKLLKTK